MTHDEVIRDICRTVALAYQSLGCHVDASDCFCPEEIEKCRCRQREWELLLKKPLTGGVDEFYRNDGHALAFVRQAVLEKLKRDGIATAKGFDSETGELLTER